MFAESGSLRSVTLSMCIGRRFGQRVHAANVAPFSLQRRMQPTRPLKTERLLSAVLIKKINGSNFAVSVTGVSGERRSKSRRTPHCMRTQCGKQCASFKRGCLLCVSRRRDAKPSKGGSGQAHRHHLPVLSKASHCFSLITRSPFSGICGKSRTTRWCAWRMSMFVP